MSFGFGFALPHWQTLSGGFSPASLFSAGEQGAWYDPSDLTTLFQDSAGTTPVTAVEQPVGLVLDKSKGLVLGSELVTNGDFISGTTGWTGVNATLAVVNGAVQITADGVGQARASQTVSGLTAGRWYEVRAKIWQGTGTVNVTLLATGVVESAAVTTTTPTDVVVRFAAIATTQTIRAGSSGIAVAGTTYFADNISVRELPGNHAYQTTSASRPTLRARYNLLTHSEQFDNGAWTRPGMLAFGSGSVVNATTAPDGTTTADLLTPDTSSSTKAVRLAVTGAGANTWSFYAKANGYTKVGIWDYATSGAYAAFLLVGSGSVLDSGSGASNPTITSVGNGWYRCSFTATVTGSLGFSMQVLSPSYTTGSVNTAWSANGTDGVYLWGAQLTQTAVFPSNTYQRIAAATDYATGSAFPPYLFFDGVDDSLLTNSVDFSAGDKMTVWAGVTKSSDASTAVVTELSASSGANAGVFVMGAPWSPVSKRFMFGSNGNAGSLSDANTASTTYNAPITNVLTGIGDISGDLSTLKINGAQVGQNTGDQGTGNFGNYPLYIGRRNNASLPLNGNIYSLIIRGAQSTAAQISSTESWVAAKTPLGSL